MYSKLLKMDIKGKKEHFLEDKLKYSDVNA
jgi:hypothetical protein